jgi:porin
MILPETPGSEQGMTVWSAFVLSPQQNIAKLPFQVNGGLVYRGLIPARDDDYARFGVVYGKFSRNFAPHGGECRGGVSQVRTGLRMEL